MVCGGLACVSGQPIWLGSLAGGGFLAGWIIAYGLVQALAPRLTAKADGKTVGKHKGSALPGRAAALFWCGLLALVPALIALGLGSQYSHVWLIGGLLLFGALFAVNSSLHSFLIVSYAREDGVSLDVGFYYMANAAGRLLGTVLSGALFQWWGLELVFGFPAPCYC